MKWCPITIRADLDGGVSASGVYLASKEQNVELVLTASALLLEDVERNGGNALGTIETSLETIEWFDLSLEKAEVIARSTESLKPYLRDFDIEPDAALKFLIFRVGDSTGFPARARLAKRVFYTAQPKPFDPIEILSSPFAAFNASLFHAYSSRGTVSLLRDDLIFADARYLEGMEGGYVGLNDVTGGSIGLVAGCISKRNGQGRLTIVLPWVSIAREVPVVHALVREAEPSPVRRNTWSGVALVQVQYSPGKAAWGSGVLVAPDLIVTNNHVLTGAYQSVSVWFERQTSRAVAAISMPMRGLDLVLLKLTRPLPGRYRPISLANSDPDTGVSVRSIGFGLFYPPKYGGILQPLSSDGVINKKLTGMLITSAKCWNGSSGGALTNTRGELVGIMASNARDASSGEIIPELSMVIPISVLKDALARYEVQDGSFPAETSPQFQKLWKLQRTHRDVKQRLKGRI